MNSRKAQMGLAAFLLLACSGCASTKREATGNRSWLGYLRYGSEDTPDEAAANATMCREVWFGEGAMLPESQGPANLPAEPTTAPPR